jgi:hypothetical protein
MDIKTIRMSKSLCEKMREDERTGWSSIKEELEIYGKYKHIQIDVEEFDSEGFDLTKYRGLKGLAPGKEWTKDE